MKFKAVSGIMLTLLLIAMFTMALGTVSVKASLVIIHEADDCPTANFGAVRTSQGYLMRRDVAHAVDLKDVRWASIRYWSGAVNDYTSSISLDERIEIDVSKSHAASYKWDFESSTEWRDFAYVDDDSAELVIGLSDMRPNSYSELANLIISNGGELVNTVSMDGKIGAVVADVPLVAMSAFVSEVDVARLSRYIEPNVRFEVDFVPNDPDWPKQWGPVKIEADDAWDIQTGDPSVLVAVIDTGVDWNHPDLVANYVALGYDWMNNDPDPMDDYGHGTHCAGIIAAVLNNGIGIAGLAQVRIMAEKGLGPEGGRSDDLAKAIVHAVDQGADILSCSWGSYTKSTVVHEALKYAYDHGVLVIGAAGNDATDIEHYPAAYYEVVAVTATDESDSPAEFTNFGDWVEVAGPGVDVYSTWWDDTYRYASGTSMSAPHVAGVAALIWSQFPSMTRDQVRAQLRYSADDLGDPGFDVYYGYGRANARRAFEQAPPDHDVLALSWKKPRYVNLGSQVTINSTILNMGASDESGIAVQLLVNDSVVDSKIVSSLVSGASASVSCLWVPTIEGAYNVTSYVVPVPGETVTENNALSACIIVRIPEVIRVPDDYETIQGAIDAAKEGDTVFVASGIYYENVWINKEGLTLVGEDQKNTIIDGQKEADVVLVSANAVKISRFTLQESLRSLTYAGISAWGSEGITIGEVTTLNNYHGIFFYSVANATLRNNNMTGNVYNFGVDGDSIMDFAHDVDASNIVNGKPVYYWVNEHDKRVPSDAGYVAIVNSTNIIVKDLSLTENYEGVLFANTINSSIENVIALNNYFGTYLAYSHNNRVHSNTAAINYVSIYLYESENNNVNDNMVTLNGKGIDLYYSKDNTIAFNKLLFNDLSFYIEKSNNNTINSNEASNNTYGLILEKSSYNILRNNKMTSNCYNFGVVGYHLVHFIHDIDPSNTVDGKPIHYLVNRKDIVIDPSTFPSLGYLGIVNSTNINVKNLNFTNNIQGILFAYTNSSTIGNINATNNFWGIFMIGSCKNTISHNNVTNNEYNLDLWYSENNTIYRNIIKNGLDGIYLQGSRNNNVVDNIITWNSWRGMWLGFNSGGNSITNNTISNNGHGIELYYSGGNTLRDNNMTANYYNFGIDGYSLSNFIQNIDASNTVDAKPIYYWVNQRNKRIPADAGCVAVINSTNITAANLSITNNVQGILFAYTANSTIIGNNIRANNEYGIYLFKSSYNTIGQNNVAIGLGGGALESGIGLCYSDRNTIAVNTVTDKLWSIDIVASNNNIINSNTLLRNTIGIYLYYSYDNIVIDNKVSGRGLALIGIALTEAKGNTISRNEVACNSWAGVYLEWSSNNNTIILNTLSDNDYGIWLRYSSNNKFYHNNFINNTQQVYMETSGYVNFWDDGYPSGGNYWSDYSGSDLYGGSYQNVTSGDGIGDTPYTIDANNEDRFPYMIEIKGPYIHGDLNHDGEIDMRDIALAARAFGSYPGHPRWNPIADINQDNKVDMRDIATIARDFGKTV